MPKWTTHDEIREYSNSTGRCPVCDGPRNRGYACQKHDRAWEAHCKVYLGTDGRPRRDASNADYLAWVNDTYENESLLLCAQCDNPCPKDDYLCKECRHA